MDQLATSAIRPRFPAGSPPPPSGNAAGSCAQRGEPQAAGHALDAEDIPDEQTGTAEQELLAGRAPRGAARGVHAPAPGCQQLIAMLIEDPPVPYAEISARLGIPVGSIGPNRGRCLDKLRRHPAIAALINADARPP